MTAKPKTPDPDEADRQAAIANVRAAVDQMTRPVRVVERYRVDPNGEHLAEHDAVESVHRKRKRDRPDRTHVQQLPDILEQLAAATEREKTTARSGGSGGSFESRPSAELGPIDVHALIRSEARELVRSITGRDLAADADRIRSRLAAAHGHARRHERIMARLYLRRSIDTLAMFGPWRAEAYRVARRHHDNLTVRALEAGAAAEQWRDQIERLNAELAIAESPRSALLAITAAVDQLGPHHLARADDATARWLDLARVAARFDAEPVTVSEPCPLCRRPNMVEVRGDVGWATARCRNPDCGAEFTRDQMSTFKRLVREQQHLATLAQPIPTDPVEEALKLIRSGYKAAGLSQASLAERAGVSENHVWRVLSGRWPASPELLATLVRVVNAALPEKEPA